MKKMLKKNNSKGFTLAELLVVIAILAILIAIAVPVFSGMVADANLRVNQANIRTVRSAAVAEILTHLEDPDDSGTGDLLNVGLNDPNGTEPDAGHHGWIATAYVNNSGDISDLRVIAINNVYHNNRDEICNGIMVGKYVFPTNQKFILGEMGDKANYYQLSDDIASDFATVRPTTKSADGSANTVYTVQVVIKDLESEE